MTLGAAPARVAQARAFDSANGASTPSRHADSLEVALAVYDLLPEGRVSWWGWTLGVGVFHTGVRIGDMCSEFAFGGHTVPQVTGVFNLRSSSFGPTACSSKLACPPVAAKRDHDPADNVGAYATAMQGARFCQLIHLGPAFGVDWSKMRRERRLAAATAEAGAADADDSTALLPNAAEIAAVDADDRPATYDDAVNQILSVIAELKDEWLGTEYDLLNRNCNHFSAELVYRLTGRTVPPYLNRAARIAASLPCLVPTAWVQPPADESPAEETVAGRPFEPPRADGDMTAVSAGVDLAAL